VLLLGAISVVSSWFSIRPASAQRYRDLMERHERDPNLVSADEWVQSKDDEGMTAIVMVFLGVPGFLVVTAGAAVLSFVPHKRRSTPLCIGSGWLILGAGLHAVAWLG
jgi:hypothetical protein